MMKKGYISIELVIVAGVVLVFGLFAVNKFVKQGNAASTKMSNALEATLSDIDAGAPTEGE